jgi:exonuclease III
MLILNWNVRGLGLSEKRRMVKNAIVYGRSDIVCLQETKLSNVDGYLMKSICGNAFTSWVCLDAVQSSGGAIVAWKDGLFQLISSVCGKYHITAQLRSVRDNNVFFISSIYGPCVSHLKEEFWNELSSLRNFCTGPWMLCGDFNALRNFEDSTGTSTIVRELQDFNNTVRDLELIEIPIQSIRYTWSSMRASPTFSKLDRFFISTEWDEMFPLSSASHCPRTTSDHFPLIFDTGQTPRNTLFRFEKVWIGVENFNELIAVWWHEVPSQNNAIKNFSMKLRHIKKQILKWRKEEFYSVRNFKKKLMEDIDAIDIREQVSGITEADRNHRAELKCSLERILHEEEIIWRQRSRQIWLKEGDHNTSFSFLC